jgi:hypothetical protein
MTDKAQPDAIAGSAMDENHRSVALMVTKP